MKYHFIVNPKAGNGSLYEDLQAQIFFDANDLNMDDIVKIHVTGGIGDAEIIANQICLDHKASESNEKIAIVACGGDGTINEVLNSIMQYPELDVALGAIPIGTGNDFVRMFEGDFLSPKKILKGSTIKCDAIYLEGEMSGLGSETEKEFVDRVRYCANMINIGFDCNVVDMTATIKDHSFIQGSAAYVAGVMSTLIKKKGANLKIEIGDKVITDGSLLMTNLGNGGYCGGGIKSTPLADVHDGLMNINVIYDVPRVKFLKIFPHYQKGDHINYPGIEKVLYMQACEEATITPLKGPMRICIDGEIIDAGKIKFKCVKDAFNFILPSEE